MIVLEEIRKETSALHSRLDNLVLTKQLMREQVTIKDYSNYVQCFYALHDRIEPVLYPKAATFLPEIIKNQRLEDLKKDLDVLNVSELNIDLPIETHHFSEKGCLGALYVMEGSRLGGRFIAKHLRNNITESDVPQFHYLERKPAVAWKEILEILSIEEHNERVEIIESAKYMFKFVEEALESAFLKLNEENKF